ncbi:MAG: 50S ribosome-binding GTPase [Methylococcaceae bacterium]
MAYDHSETSLKQAQAWADSAEQAGWITPAMASTLTDTTLSQPDGLFKTSASRPLIVAFMGGTGVGKSSLLNRLAGKAIAIAGVERPTSKEVTLYHHQSLAIQELPANLPLQKIRLSVHEDLQYKQLVWLDMPDFDSTESANQDLVLEWLPYIDVLIYVVSPERYRDNKAWQLLLAEGARHAWVFVLNQWDKGFTEQYNDFKTQLHLAGFDNPLVFKTDCSLTLPDEFAALQQCLADLATDQTVQQLAARGVQVRQQALTTTLQAIVVSMGSTQAFDTLLQQWPTQWQKTAATLQQGFAWPMQLQAKHYAEQQSSATKSLNTTEQVLWDEWAQNRINDVLDAVIDSADDLLLPVTPLKKPLNELRNKAANSIAAATSLEVRRSLANPGSKLQRVFLNISLFCEVVLPVGAMGLVGYTVFQGYYQSNLSHQNYLGIDFATHSALLIGLSWLIPFFMRKKLKPSLQKAALSGLQKGLEKGLSEIEYTVIQAIENTKQQQINSLKEVDQLIIACQQTSKAIDYVEADSTLGRMLSANA